MMLMDDHFFPLDGQVSSEGICAFSKNTKPAARLPSSLRRADVDEVRRTELVEEAWAEVSQTDEVKRNLEILQAGDREGGILARALFHAALT